MFKHALLGGCRISAPIDQKERLLNLCMRYELIYNDFIIDKGRECVIFTCTVYTAKKLKIICATNNIRIHFDSFFGLPYIVTRYKHRYGILVGILLAFFIIGMSQIYLWDVRVSGNISMSEDEIINLLDDHGLRAGSIIRDIDVDGVENKVLISSKDISWISVNLSGTVAFVEVRESLHSDKNNTEATPANLVASKDGIVEFTEVYEGKLMVVKGQLVRKGDILASGVYDSLAQGYRYTRSKGNIIARTVSTLCVEIPYVYNKKTYISEEIQEKNIVFFSKTIKLCRNTGFLGATYDTIYKIDNLCFPNGTRLPLEYHTVTRLGYTYEAVRRSPEEAIDVAYHELDKQINEIKEDGATLLKKEVVGEIGDSSYILTCTLTLLENIAETVEFEVSELMEDK